jgi:hypothetical protein
VGEDSKCTSTFLLGLKRHHELRDHFWKLLLQIIKGRELEFFADHYPAAFSTPSELVETTTCLVSRFVESPLKEEIVKKGVIAGWLEVALALPRQSAPAQSITFGTLSSIQPSLQNLCSTSLILWMKMF